MKISEAVKALLQKHKIVGDPCRNIEVDQCLPPTSTLKAIKFFEKIEECEHIGVLLGYDELVEYTGGLSSSEEEEKEIEKLLRSVYGERLHSFFLGRIKSKYYLHLRYTRNIIYEKIINGPEIIGNIETKEGKEFKTLWNDKVEYRRFDDGKIRICASFLSLPLHAMPFVLLSMIFMVKLENGSISYGKISTSSAGPARVARLFNPGIALEEFESKYLSLNRIDGTDKIRKVIDAIRESLPIKVNDALYTGSLFRKTRAIGDTHSVIYLRIGSGHRWPVEDSELFSSAITALNGVLGNTLQKAHAVEGISSGGSLFARIRNEPVEFIFEIEEEMPINAEKYSLMRFRLSYERFFKGIACRNDIFPQICMQIKQILHAHGLYPYYIGDKVVELLCFRTAINCSTLASGIKSVLSTEYTYGYTMDIRKTPIKMRPKTSGKIQISHESGIFSISLPSAEVFAHMNSVFRQANLILEKRCGVQENFIVSDLFKKIFIPNGKLASFSLSNLPLKDYTEIAHYQSSLGGCSKSSSFKKCFETLHSLGCIAYFCSSGRIFVYVPTSSLIPQIIGVAVLLSGMKYIRTSAEKLSK
ncbi:hypothetical protein NEFER03_1236 [Nematocida sp. LUAm3]|nr:hypothetical protein NEFER03_1236 [Nematocida sp. LUAm3]KAI5175845.1 hypothetical protein NEFER02_1714 [Nematocida sp. LUAm2]KAI5178341.1 hypothetical protein NEFER01_1508 [Nematocida sp. LUAm1]